LSLGQLSWGDPNAVRALPEPGLLRSLVLENPWPLGGGLALAALIGFFVFNQRGQARRGIVVAAGCVLAAIAVVVVASVITTDREAVLLQTERLVNATGAADAGSLAPMLTDDVRIEARLAGLSVPTPRGRAAVLAMIEDQLGRVQRLREYSIMENQASIDGPGVGRSQVRVRVTPQASEFWTFVWVKVDWRRGEDGVWRASTIEPLAIWAPGSNLGR
jgi:hypothetical protein